MSALRIAMLLSVCLAASAAHAGGAAIVRIASSETPNPGGYPPGYPQGTLTNFGRPMVEGDTVSFRARVQLLPNTSTDGGLYRGSGGALTTLVDVYTPVPGGSGNFGSMWGESLGNGVVAFTAIEPPGKYLLATADGLSVQRALDMTDPVPGGSHPFNGFGITAVDGSDVVFVGWEQVTYRPVLCRQSGGGTSLIAAAGQPLPNDPGQVFQRIDSDNLQVEDGVVVFVHENTGAEDPIGIYRHDGVATTLIADLATPVPDGSGTFSAFQTTGGPILAFDGRRLVFQGVDASARVGLYQHRGGLLSRLVRSDAGLPPNVSAIREFLGFSVQGQVLVFAAAITPSAPLGKGTPGPFGLYALTPVGYEVLALSGQSLDGMSIGQLGVGPSSFDLGRLAFHAQDASDYTKAGIYRTVVDWMFGDGMESD